MTQHKQTPRLSTTWRRPLATVIAVAAALLVLHGPNAHADLAAPNEYRVVSALGKFDDVAQLSVAYHLRAPQQILASHLELAFGALTGHDKTRGFVSIGPVWRVPFDSDRFFVQLGFSPTLISGSYLSGRDLGGNLHFTSSLTAGATFGATDNVSIALRIQHISNGGLSSDNPGLDMLGLNVAIGLFD